LVIVILQLSFGEKYNKILNIINYYYNKNIQVPGQKNNVEELLLLHFELVFFRITKQRHAKKTLAVRKNKSVLA